MHRKEVRKMEDYGQEFLEVMRRMKSLTSGRIVQRNGKVYHGEYMMLMSIHALYEKKETQNCPGVRVGELSRHMHSGKPATSKMLRSIEEKGYIERVNDPLDRRSVYVRLTKAGQEIITESQQQYNLFTEAILKKLGNKDAGELIRILKRVCQFMEEEIQERSGSKQ